MRHDVGLCAMHDAIRELVCIANVVEVGVTRDSQQRRRG
jgi:hypothetical protein